MNKRKAIAERLNHSHNQINRLLVDLELRYLGCRKTDVDYSLVFNECFVLMENIRNTLKEPKVTTQYLCYPVKEMEDDILLVATMLVTNIMRFTDKWSVPYTSWLSSFKSHAKNRHLFNDGTSESYLTYQCNFPKLEAMSSDFEELQKVLQNASTALSNRKGAFIKGDFIHVLFMYSTSGLLYYIRNFFKIRKVLKAEHNV